MTRRRTTARYPEAPTDGPPSLWLSVDPGGTKLCTAVLWAAANPRQFVAVRSRGQVRDLLGDGTLGAVVVEGGYSGRSPRATTSLDRTREQWATIAELYGVAYVEAPPDAWRAVLSLPARGRAVKQGSRDLVQQLAGGTALGGVMCPRMATAATNDDRREALLLGLASVLAWGWA